MLSVLFRILALLSGLLCVLVCFCPALDQPVLIFSSVICGCYTIIFLVLSCALEGEPVTQQQCLGARQHHGHEDLNLEPLALQVLRSECKGSPTRDILYQLIETE